MQNFGPNFHTENCLACNLGCSVSESGYSPMTYNPYGNKERRKGVTLDQLKV